MRSPPYLALAWLLAGATCAREDFRARVARRVEAVRALLVRDGAGR